MQSHGKNKTQTLRGKQKASADTANPSLNREHRPKSVNAKTQSQRGDRADDQGTIPHTEGGSANILSGNRPRAITHGKTLRHLIDTLARQVAKCDRQINDLQQDREDLLKDKIQLEQALADWEQTVKNL